MGQPGFTEQSSVFPHGASEVFTIRPCCGSASEQGWGGAPGPYRCSGCAPLCQITAITCLAHMWFHTNSLTDSHDTGRGRALGSNGMKEIAGKKLLPHGSFFLSFSLRSACLFDLRLQIWTVLTRKHTETAQSLGIGTDPNQWAWNSGTRTVNHAVVPLTSSSGPWFLAVTRSGLTVILLAALDVK